MKKVLLYNMMAFFLAFNLIGQQVQNPGFENWEDAGTVIDEPVNWSSIKTSDGGDLINGFAPVVWGQSNDAHSGNYSVELTNVQTIVVATGTLTNGRFHAEVDPEAGFAYTNPDDEQWHTVLTDRPDSVAIWVKYSPIGSDTAQVKALLHMGDGSLPPTPENQANWIAFAQINITGTIDTWTRFVVPFSYFSTDDPEYILIILTAGAGTQAIPESKVWYDDMELIYNPQSVNEMQDNLGLIYAAGNSIYLGKLPASKLDDSRIDILNLNGSVVFSASVTSNIVNTELAQLSQGVYLVRIYRREINYSEKIYLK